MYLKEEHEAISDVTPSLPFDKYLKIGTFKINAHDTKLGERFIKKAFDIAIDNNIRKLYVTIFPKHEGLIKLFLRYGFKKVSKKKSPNGVEDVLLKEIDTVSEDVNIDYPIINLKNKQYLLSIYPDYHTKLFPDSILNNEDASIVNDVSHTNSIGKIYICKMPRVGSIKKGDALVIYRTSDKKGPAWYRSVATSLCMVEEVKSKKDFISSKNFVDYCLDRSIFSEDELYDFFNTWPNIYVVKMTYNAALKNRIIRKILVEKVGLSINNYWGIIELTALQYKNIAKLGGVGDSLIFN